MPLTLLQLHHLHRGHVRGRNTSFNRPLHFQGFLRGSHYAGHRLILNNSAGSINLIQPRPLWASHWSPPLWVVSQIQPDERDQLKGSVPRVCTGGGDTMKVTGLDSGPRTNRWFDTPVMLMIPWRHLLPETSVRFFRSLFSVCVSQS